MEYKTARRKRLTQYIHWTARIWSIVSIGLVLAFLVGEGFDPSKFKATELLGFLFFPVGISVGMILAWWREGIGGIITVGSLLTFYIINLATAGMLPKGWAWLVFAAPGFLFLVCWYWSRKTKTADD
ncbi:MAG: hypothetical protein ABSC53_14115 [Bacteroidota bacterium]|jgi:hypothetical protein